MNYEITGKTKELNADGTYRGEGDAILLKNIAIFNDEYSNVQSTLNDWRMYGFLRIMEWLV